MAFRQDHPDCAVKWYTESNYIVILEIENEYKLNELIEKAILRKIKFSIFKESDLDDQVTAVCLEPGDNTKKLCSNLRLALRGRE